MFSLIRSFFQIGIDIDHPRFLFETVQGSYKMFMDVHINIDVQSSYEEIYPQFLVVGLELVTG